MKRREFLRHSAAAVAGSSLLRYLPDFQSDGFREIRNGIGIFEKRGGTIGWLATDDALVVIDSQFPESAQECLAGLKKRSDRALDLFINTHHHGDHTSGNSVFVPKAASSIAHQNVPILQKASFERNGGDTPPTVVKYTYVKQWHYAVGKEEVSLTHYGPAHTGGDSIVHFPHANIAHMGDLVFNRLPPYIDRSANATVDGWITVLEAAHKSFDDDTVVIAGHGNEKYGVTGSRADLLVMRDYLSALREYVQSGIREGKSAEDLKVSKLPGFEEHYNEGWQEAVPNGIQAAYEEYATRM